MSKELGKVEIFILHRKDFIGDRFTCWGCEEDYLCPITIFLTSENVNYRCFDCFKKWLEEEFKKYTHEKS